MSDIDEGVEVVVAIALLRDRAEKCGLAETARKLQRLTVDSAAELAALNEKEASRG